MAQRQQRERVCEQCSAAFLAVRSDARFCAVCRKDRMRRAGALADAKRRAPVDKSVPRNTCVDCGGLFIALRSDRQRCDDCLKAHLTALEKARERTYNACPDCGSAIVRHAIRCRACASKLRGLKNRGENSGSWRGGRAKDGDYILVRVGTTYVREHRHVWEQANGPIPEKWQVHHLNGIKTDNRIENLVAMSNADHHRDHHSPWQQRIQDLEDRIRELEQLKE